MQSDRLQLETLQFDILHTVRHIAVGDITVGHIAVGQITVGHGDVQKLRAFSFRSNNAV
jgi:hypothetical protein